MSQDPYEWFDPEVGRSGITKDHCRLAMYVGLCDLDKELTQRVLQREAGVQRVTRVPVSALPRTIAAFKAISGKKR